MSDPSFEKRGGVAAVAFVALSLAAFAVVKAPPGIDAEAEEILEYMVSNRSGGLNQVLLYALTLPFFLIFLEALRRRVAGDSGSSGPSTVGAVAGGLFYAISALGSALFFAAAWNPDTAGAIGADVALALWNAGYLFWMLSFPTAALMLAAFSWCSRESKAFPPWHLWLSAGSAVVMLIGAAGVASQGVAALSLWAYMLVLVWALASGVLMIRQPSSASA